MSGKGDSRRPAAIPRDEYAERWERTFGKKPLPNVDPAPSWVPAHTAYEYDAIVGEPMRFLSILRDDRRDHDRHPSNPL